MRTVVLDPSSHPFRGATTELEWRPLRRAAASTRPLEKAPVRVERSRREKSCKRHAAERLRVDSRCLPGDLRIDKPSSACCCTFKAGWYVDREDEEGARNIKILAAKLMRCLTTDLSSRSEAPTGHVRAERSRSRLCSPSNYLTMPG